MVGTTSSKSQFSGNGVTTVFSFPYRVDNASDLKVLLTNTLATSNPSTLKTYLADYTLTGIGSDSGVTVTMLVAPPSNYTLTIYRDPSITQVLDLVASQAFNADSLEASLDKLTAICQRLKEITDRCIKITDADVDESLEVGTDAQRPLTLLGFDSNSNLYLYPVTDPNSPVSLTFPSQVSTALLDPACVTPPKVAHGAYWTISSANFNSNVYSGNSSPTLQLAELVTGTRVVVNIPNPNADGTVYLNVNSLGNKKILLPGGATPSAGDIAVGVAEFIYSSSLDSGSGAWVMINSIASASQVYTSTTKASSAYSLAGSSRDTLTSMANRVLFWTVGQDSTIDDTLNVQGSGAKKILMQNGQGTVVGSLVAGQKVASIYDPSANSGAGAHIVLGIEQPSSYVGSVTAATGSSVTISVPGHPSSPVPGAIITFKHATASNTGAVNVTISQVNVSTDLFRNKVFELGANDMQIGKIYSIVYDGTQYQLLNPDRDLVSADISIPASGSASFNHQLGFAPSRVRWVFVCTDVGGDPGAGYAQGDEVPLDCVTDGTYQARRNNEWADATICAFAKQNVQFMASKTGTAIAAITLAKWRARCYYAP